MKQYAGLDVSLETTSICIVDETGRILAERKVATCPDAIARELRAEASGLARAGIEAGPLAVRPWGELRRWKLPILRLDARHANAALKVMPGSGMLLAQRGQLRLDLEGDRPHLPRALRHGVLPGLERGPKSGEPGPVRRWR